MRSIQFEVLLKYSFIVGAAYILKNISIVKNPKTNISKISMSSAYCDKNDIWNSCRNAIIEDRIIREIILARNILAGKETISSKKVRTFFWVNIGEIYNMNYEYILQVCKYMTSFTLGEMFFVFLRFFWLQH